MQEEKLMPCVAVQKMTLTSNCIPRELLKTICDSQHFIYLITYFKKTKQNRKIVILYNIENSVIFIFFNIKPYSKHI